MLARFKDKDLAYRLSKNLNRVKPVTGSLLRHKCTDITLMVPAFESVKNMVPAEFTSISIPVMGQRDKEINLLKRFLISIHLIFYPSLLFKSKRV